MEHIIVIIRISFLFFIGYTSVYLFQWLVGIIISINRLSHSEENREYVRRAFHKSVANCIPVSVIVPACNEEACICGTVDALLQEGYPNLEVIIVDDGSTDGTAKKLIETYRMEPCSTQPNDAALETMPVLECFCKRLDHVRLLLVRKQNGGKSDALNCGFNFASSQYCVVVDADTQVHPGSLRVMVSKFLLDHRTVVCAGVVGSFQDFRHTGRHLSLAQKALVLFQHIEYCRTFYIYRMMFDALNANVIVSGAFAMFDRNVVIQAGGYKTNIIGEDMELTMRLHAFCISQNRDYRISFAPEARCDTQVPYRYRDYFRQRRRWHIGLIQSLLQHFYMIGSHYYGWVGILSVVFTMIYELFAPFIETFGFLIVIAACALKLSNPLHILYIMGIYLIISLMMQSLLFSALNTYQIEHISFGRHLILILIAATECIIFHPINLIVKIATVFTYHKYEHSWGHIQRSHSDYPTAES